MGEKPASNRLDRRDYLKASSGALVLASFAGCTGFDDDEEGEQETTEETPMGDETVDMGEFGVPSENVKPQSEITNAEQRRVGQMPLFAQPQGTAPNQYEAAQIFAENVSKLGVEVPIQTMNLNTIFDKAYIRRQPKEGQWWYWSMWEFSPRVTRLDPDELLFNHHTRRQTGYNWMYWEDAEYDETVVAQRQAVDREERQELVYKCQEILHERGPQNILVYPEIQLPYNSEKWEGITNIKGLGPANMLTFSNARPLTDDREFVAGDTAGRTFKTITPWGFGNELDIRQNRMIYDRLLWPTPSGTEFQNRLATNVEFADNETVIVDIREGHSWHDGREVLAEDVKFSYDFNNPDSDKYDFTTNYGGSLDPVSSVEIEDDHRLRINLEAPFSSLKLSTFVRVPIAQKTHWEEVIESDDFKNRGTDVGHYTPQTNIGSGPMQFDSWDQDANRVRLTAYEDHYDPIEYDSRVTTSISGVQQALGQMTSGELDLITQYTGEVRALEAFAEDNDNISIKRTNSCVMDFMSYNTDHPPNNIKEFRRASFHCWNEDEIAETIYDGRGTAGNNSMVSPVLEYWFNDELENHGEDLQAAANELASADFVWDEENGELYMPEGRHCLTEEEYRNATKHGDRFSRDLVKCD